MCKTCKTCFLSGTKIENNFIINDIGEYSGNIDKIYKLNINKESVFVTGNHFCLTQNGYKKVEDLSQIDDLLTDNLEFYTIDSIDLINGFFDIYSFNNFGTPVKIGKNKLIFADEELNEKLSKSAQL